MVPGKEHQVRSLRLLPERREQRYPAGCCECACRPWKGRMICLRHMASSEALYTAFANWQLSSDRLETPCRKGAVRLLLGVPQSSQWRHPRDKESTNVCCGRAKPAWPLRAADHGVPQARPPAICPPRLSTPASHSPRLFRQDREPRGRATQSVSTFHFFHAPDKEGEQQSKFCSDTLGTKGVRTEFLQEVIPFSGTENGM